MSARVLIPYKGKMLTTKELSDATGISTSAITQRRQKGLTPEQIIAPIPNKLPKCTYSGNKATLADGNTYTAAELSKMTKLPYSLIISRMYNGTPLERLLLPSSAAPDHGTRGRSNKYDLHEATDPVKGYTESELYDLYRGFAGDVDELKRLAGFMGVQQCLAVKMLDKLKARYAAERHFSKPKPYVREVNSSYLEGDK